MIHSSIFDPVEYFLVRQNRDRNSKIRVLRSKNMSTKKSEKIKDDFIIMKKLIKQKLDEWDTGNIQNEINKISILEDKPSGWLTILTHQSSADRSARRYMLSVPPRKIGKAQSFCHVKNIYF